MANHLLAKFVNKQIEKVGLHLSKHSTFTMLSALPSQLDSLNAEVERLRSATRRKTRYVSEFHIEKMLEQSGGQPGWAAHLPDDPRTFHVGNSSKARDFQELIDNTPQCAGWSASHMCLMRIICFFQKKLPRRYLEIGVNEGLSIYALITSLRLQGILHRPNHSEPPLDELVLADMWGDQFGGTNRGSHQHIADLLASVGLPSQHVTFLDGNSRETVPAYLKARKSHELFDAVYVDGEHTYDGAKTDLENVLPFVGDILLFDDMYHPAHCLHDRLLELHCAMVGRLKNDFYVFMNRQWFGFAAFIRKSTFDRLAG